jgi:tetratricopeptide (TPR) repeat protein
MAQDQKIGQSLKRTRDFLGAGQLEEAQCELAFLSVLAPGAADVLALDAELSRRRQEAEQALRETQRKQAEEARERELLLRQEIDRCVAEAEELCSQDRFDEALRVLTDAYLLDPNSDVVEGCESRIVEAQRRWEERIEMERRAHEAAVRRAEEEARSREAEEKRLRLIALEEEHDRQRKMASQKEIANHLAAARTSLAGNRFREALAEVALAFVLDPLSDEVKSVEREILALQAAANRVPETPAPSIELPPEVEANLETIAHLLTEAKRLAHEQRYVAALHEANKALALDPDNLATRKVVASIKGEYEVYQDEQKTARPGSSRQKNSSHLRLAKPADAQKPDNVVQLIRQDLDASPIPGEATENPAAPKSRWWSRVKDAWREAVAEAEAEAGARDEFGNGRDEPAIPEPEKVPSAEIPPRILRLL